MLAPAERRRTPRRTQTRKVGRCAWAAALCLLGASCGRIDVIAVEGPEEPELDPDTGQAPDADSLDPELADTATAGEGSSEAGPALNTPIDAGNGQAATDASAADGGASQDGGADGAGPASDAGLEAMLPACGGARVRDLCWYLGNAGASCQQTCSNKGGYDVRTTALVGTTTQGGSLSACAQVLSALGYRGSVTAGLRSDGVGLGCHLWGSDGWWLQTMPELSRTASIPVASIACACMR